MKKVIFSLLMSLALIFTTVASSYAGVNLPDDKKKKSCCKTENKDGKKEDCKKGEKKDCCKDGKKNKKSCETESKDKDAQ